MKILILAVGIINDDETLTQFQPTDDGQLIYYASPSKHPELEFATVGQKVEISAALQGGNLVWKD